MNNTLIRWYSIAEAAMLIGLAEDFIREQVKLKKLRAKTFGNKDGMVKITDLELNRFSLDLQYPRHTAEKASAMRTMPINDEQSEFLSQLTKELIK